MSSLLDLQPRGLAMLQAMVPSAQKQIESFVEIILESGIKNIAMNILCGGGFGWCPSFIGDISKEMSSGGRKLHTLFYLSNGPSARHYKTTKTIGFGTKISPDEFRGKIENDPEFQEEFQDLQIRLNPVIEIIHNLGGDIRVVPQLEDNQTDGSFNVMLELVKKVLPEGIPVELGRNPCKNCYPGNGVTIPDECFGELHLHSTHTDFKTSNGIVTNDGCTYKFGHEKVTFDPHVYLNDEKKVMIQAGKQDDWFILWSAKFQGLSSGAPEDPYKRDYVLPDSEETKILIDFLRYTGS